MRLNIEDFDYHLDPSLIALYPPSKRDEARLLVFHRDTGEIEHHKFSALVHYLDEGDILILNDTRVFPARFYGRKRDTGGRVELLLVKNMGEDTWEVLCRGKIRKGQEIEFSSNCWCEVIDKKDEKTFVRFLYSGCWEDIITSIGRIPLPPYIKRPLQDMDREWYQTVYAKHEGSIAAPTAGLHFTPHLLKELEDKGVIINFVTLHIGPGTFKPVKTKWVNDHQMDYEFYQVTEDVVTSIKEAKRRRKKVIAVGTTTVKALEHASLMGELKESAGLSNLFIYPGFQFKVIDGLITNFHLPKSTLLLLVSAFCGKENLKRIYAEAMRLGYKFYSYGDAMLAI